MALHPGKCQMATQGFPKEELTLGLQQMCLPMQSSQSCGRTLQVLYLMQNAGKKKSSVWQIDLTRFYWNQRLYGTISPSKRCVQRVEPWRCWGQQQTSWNIQHLTLGFCICPRASTECQKIWACYKTGIFLTRMVSSLCDHKSPSIWNMDKGQLFWLDVFSNICSFACLDINADSLKTPNRRGSMDNLGVPPCN